MKKQFLIRIILAVLMTASAAVAALNFSIIQNSLFQSAYSPSAMCIGEDGVLYVVNSSKKAINAIDRDGYIVGQFDVGNRAMQSIEFITADTQSGCIYIKTSTTYAGTLISGEDILRWDPAANKAELAYSVLYKTSEAPYQYGNIKSLRVSGGHLYFAQVNDDRISVYRLGDAMQAEQLTEYGIKGHVSQITLLSEVGTLAYTTREGGVYKASPGETVLLFDSAQVTGGDFISVPWMLCADDNDRLVFTDLGRRLVVSLPDGGVIENPDGQILYALAVDGSTVYATDYSSIYISHNGAPLQPDGRTYHDTPGVTAWHLFVFFCAVFAALIFLYLAVLAVHLLLQKVKKETTKRLLLSSLSSVLIATFIALLSGGDLLANEKSAMLQTLKSTGYAMQCFISENTSDFTSIDTLGDYQSAQYNNLKQLLDNLTEASYFAGADMKTPMYYILYKNVGGTICSVMDYEDSMCAIHPLDIYEDSDYQAVCESGEASALIDYRGAYGDWQYILFPVSSQAPDGQDIMEPGSITGFLEVGINTAGLAAELRTLVLKLVLEIVFFTVLFLMILIEAFKATAYIGAYKKSSGRLSTESGGELMGFIRLITLLVFLTDALQESFFAAVAGKMAIPFFSLSGEMAGAIPISVELFACAVFSVFSGKLLVRKSVSQLLKLGFAADAVGFLMCAFAITGNYPLLLFGKVLIGAGMGICIAAANVCASSIPEEKSKNSAFAELNAGILAGATIGFAAGSHIAKLAGYTAVYLTGAVVLVVGAALVTRYVPAFSVRVGRDKITSLRFVLNRRVLGFLLCALLPFLVLINFREYFFVVYASQNGLSEDSIGQLFLLCGLIIIYVGPMISRRVTGLVGDKVMVFLAIAVFLAALLLFAVVPGLPAAVAGVVLVSLGISFGYTAQSNYYTELPVIRKTDSANSMGIYLLFDNLGQTIGPVVFGSVMTYGSQRGILYIFLGFAGMAALFAASSLTRRERVHENR